MKNNQPPPSPPSSTRDNFSAIVSRLTIDRDLDLALMTTDDYEKILSKRSSARILFFRQSHVCRFVCPRARAYGFPNSIETYGVVSGLWTSTFALGAFIGPSVAGILLDNVGFRNGSMFIVLLHLVVVRFCSRLSRIAIKTPLPIAIISLFRCSFERFANEFYSR